MDKLFLSLLFLLIFQLSFAQNYDILDIPFIENNEQVKNPFTGGFEAPQVVKADLNRDGISDIITYDRFGGVVNTFINDGLGNGSFSYKYEKEYESIFPEFNHYMIIADYNQDGIEDLFVGNLVGVFGVMVFTGYVENNRLQFRQYMFPAFVDRGYQYNIATISLNGNDSNIYTSNIDRPSIIDVDSDGDLDILSFQSGTTIFFYKNVAVENGLSLDVLEFVLETDCYGRFFESGLSEEVELSDNPNECAAGLVPSQEDPSSRHSGSTILSLDHDADGDYEIILGDFTSSRLVMLENGGDKDQAWMTDVDTRFPSYDVPVFLDQFVGAFYEDVDEDGIKDLLVAPNQFNKVENIDNILLYKNLGENDQPDFEFTQNDFLTETTLDFGTFCLPTFGDINNDGLMDLLVGSFGAYDATNPTQVGLAYYVNTGTISEPVFTLEDDDYLNFSSFRESIDRPAPTFGDLDNDGDDDLLIGSFEGFLVYYENTAAPGAPAEYDQYEWEYMGIDIGKHSKPFIIDLDEDGLNDIVVGLQAAVLSNIDETVLGDMIFFKNIGTEGSPQFDPDHTALPNISAIGGVNSIFQFVSDEFSSPFILKTEDDFKLFTASKEGHIKVYDNISNNLEGLFDVIDPQLGGLNMGTHSVISMADIDDDGWLEIVMGNARGGLAMFNTIVRNDGVITSSSEVFSDNGKELKVFPNPTRDMITFELDQMKSAQLFDINSKLILETELNYLNIKDLENGVYFLQVFDGEEMYTQSVIKI